MVLEAVLECCCLNTCNGCGAMHDGDGGGGGGGGGSSGGGALVVMHTMMVVRAMVVMRAVVVMCAMVVVRAMVVWKERAGVILRVGGAGDGVLLRLPELRGLCLRELVLLGCYTKAAAPLNAARRPAWLLACAGLGTYEGENSQGRGRGHPSAVRVSRWQRLQHVIIDGAPSDRS